VELVHFSSELHVGGGVGFSRIVGSILIGEMSIGTKVKTDLVAVNDRADIAIDRRGDLDLLDTVHVQVNGVGSQGVGRQTNVEEEDDIFLVQAVVGVVSRSQGVSLAINSSEISVGHRGDVLGVERIGVIRA